jgi:hypothetical protein
MAPEQDWCLECGKAVTTRLERPPSWRLPVAVALGTLALLALVVLLTVKSLDDHAEKAASGGPQGPGATTPARRTPARATTAPVPVWPPGKRAYTVVALTTPDRAVAERAARRQIAAGRDAGILRSDGYDFFSPGAWVVWAGRYAARPTAERALPRVRRTASRAYVTLIRRRAD